MDMLYLLATKDLTGQLNKEWDYEKSLYVTASFVG